MLASDLSLLSPPPRAPAALSPITQVYNWGGVYFGFNLGASAIQGNTLIGVASSAAPGPITIQERFTSNVGWFAAVTGRVGYAANDWLFYAKGGGAWMHVSYTEDLLVADGGTSATQVISDNRTGFTVGAGIEFGLVENISGRIEYDFYDFGSRNYNFGITPVSVSSNLHTLTVGINYKFNWSGGPKP
jgi:outer membrane immunogenic protein